MEKKKRGSIRTAIFVPLIIMGFISKRLQCSQSETVCQVCSP